MFVFIVFNWFLNFGIVYGIFYMVDINRIEGFWLIDFGFCIFFFWGVFCIFLIVFVWFMVYEMSKISLEQIDEMYERVDYVWNS